MTDKEFKKKYNLVEPSHSLLRTKLEKFDFNNPPVDPVELGTDMLAHMRYYGGIGLSANQLGLPYRVFVMEGEPGFVCFNPVITASAGEDILLDEGCLTFPGFYLKKRRPEMIRVRFMDPYGNPCVKKFNGMSARCFQHELEHLEGGNFMEGVSDLVLQRAKDKQRKLLRQLRKRTRDLKKVKNK